MDFSGMPSQSSLFAGTAFGGASTATATATTAAPASAAASGTAPKSPTASAQGNGSVSVPDKIKEKRFNDWHQKQGLPPPQDYNIFVSQPAPFSTVPQNPNQPTAASPYLQKVLSQQPVPALPNHNSNDGFGDSMFSSDLPDGRRKPPIKRTSSTSPPNPGAWPRSMFGTRPPSRTRARTASTPDLAADLANTEENAPPLMSIYDNFLPASASASAASAAPATAAIPPTAPIAAAGVSSDGSKEYHMTPTQVHVANFSEERFPDLVCALRRYYGPILEPYSGLPASESKFSDPDIVPRDRLDLKTARMVQPVSGSDGGPGPWVRITFRDRDAAERAVDGAARGELVIGGRTILIAPWEKDAAEPTLPFWIDGEPATTATATGVAAATAAAAAATVPQMQRRPSRPTVTQVFEDPPADVVLSEHLAGAKVLVPKQVEFAKREGWLSGWTNALVGAGRPPPSVAGTAPHAPAEPLGWTGGLGRSYRYVMDEVVGFKYL